MLGSSRTWVKRKTSQTISNVKKVRLRVLKECYGSPGSPLRFSQEMEGRVTVTLTLWTLGLYQKIVFPDFSPPLTCSSFANSFSSQGHKLSPPLSSQIVSSTKFPGKRLTCDLPQDPTFLENLESGLDRTPILCLAPSPFQQVFGRRWCSFSFVRKKSQAQRSKIIHQACTVSRAEAHTQDSLLAKHDFITKIHSLV